MTTLPDNGEKLKKSIEQIDGLLQKQDIAQGMSGLAISPPSDTIRKRSVDQAMELADKATSNSSSLLATKTTELQVIKEKSCMNIGSKTKRKQKSNIL